MDDKLLDSRASEEKLGSHWGWLSGIRKIPKLLAAPLQKIIGRFRQPTEETVDEVLEHQLGVTQDDESYPELKSSLVKLIGGREKEDDAVEFFGSLSKTLKRKIERKIDEVEEETKKETKEEYGQKIRSLQESLGETTPTIISEFTSTGILTLEEPVLNRILNPLKESRRISSSSLEQALSDYDDAEGVLGVLQKYGIIESLRKNGGEYFSITQSGEKLIEKNKEDFEGLIDSSDESILSYLASQAVDGREKEADVLYHRIRGEWGREHCHQIGELYKRHEKPLQRIGREFFKQRENGDSHEKHLGVKIDDYEAAGALLLLRLITRHKRSDYLMG